MTELSIVTTLYQSASHLEEFHSRISAVAQKLTDSFEIIFVNDGSPDHSLDIVIDLSKKDSKVKIIDLSRNFGHHKAIMTGLAHAKAQRVFLVDCDLEEEPELLLSFWQEFLDDPKLDQVFGVQGQRRGTIFDKVSGSLWFKLINLISDVKLVENQITARLMSQRYVQSLIQFQERELNFITLTTLTGYKSKEALVKKGHKGSSTYNIFKKFNIMINTITASTPFPLWMIFYFGLAVNFLATIYTLYIIYKKLILGVEIEIEGWASMIIVTMFLGGSILLALGIIGLYLSKILIEVKHRPYSIIRAKYNFNGE